MRHVVRIGPSPTWRDLLPLRPKARQSDHPLRDPRTILFSKGRHALFAAMRAAALPPGTGVLVPAFHCGVEVEALARAGLRVSFYPVSPAFRTDAAAIAGAADTSTRAVLVIHPFGLFQPLDDILALCRARGWLLIEDCCQALYTRDEHGAWAGTSGDIALWSFRKFLASPDGGAVLVRAGPRVEPPPDRPPTLAASLRVALDFRAGLRADPRLPVRIAGAILGAMLDAFVTESDADRGPFDASSPTPYPFVPDEVRWRPSPVSIRILARTDDERVATRRRAHFARLAQAVRGQGAIEPAVVDLPAGACPSVFPIIARDPEAFIRRLIAARIPVDRYWQWCHPLFPATRFPVEADLKRRIVALPVHQDLTERELTLLASVLHQP